MFNQVINWFDDRVNPIAVKELRQATNNSVITTIMLLLLSVMLLLTYWYMNLHNVTSFDCNQRLFPYVMFIVDIACCLIIIPYSANRFYNELRGGTADLIYTTLQGPYALMWGKISSTICIIMLLYSLVVPFLAITFLFPGVNLWMVGSKIVGAFLTYVFFLQLLFLLATGSSNIISFRIILLLYIGFVGYLVIYEFNLDRYSSFNGILNFLENTIPFIFLWGFFFIASACSLKTPQANKALALRLYVAVCWILSLAVAFGFVFFEHYDYARSFSEVWMTLSVIFTLFFLAASFGERSEYNERLKRSIPENKMLRVLYFPFFSGDVNGMIFSLLLLILTVLIYQLTYFGGYNDSTQVVLGLAGYTVWYGMLARIIRRATVKRFPKLKMPYILLIIIFFFTVIPVLIFGALNNGFNYNLQKIWKFLYLSILIVIDKESRLIGLQIGWGLSLLFLLFSLKGYILQIKGFKPLKESVSRNKT